MLERYNGKRITVVTGSGDVFTGTAEHSPSGYGLAEFGVNEESLSVDDTVIFLSDIRSIFERESEQAPEDWGERLYPFMAKMLDGPYWIADILPRRVPADSRGQYFAADRYYRDPERISAIHRRHAEILIKLNCYYDMGVSFDSCEHWELNPDPEEFAARTAALSGLSFLRAVFPDQQTMIDVEPDDTYMTVFCRDGGMLDLITELARADGFFVWPGQD